MSLVSAVPLFAPFVAGAQIGHGLLSGKGKSIERAVKNAKQDMGTLSTIVQTLRCVKSEDDLLTALRTPLPELAGTATLGMVLKTFAEQNLKGDYADLGWDPNPKLRAAVAFLESLGVPTMPGSAFNKAGGPPPNPYYPETPAFHSLFQNTAVPYGVHGVRLNDRDARQTWDPIIGALADMAVRVNPRFATMGPEPISNERLNERFALGRSSAAGMPKNTLADVQALKAAALAEMTSPTDLFPRGRFAEGPEALQERLYSYYESQTGKNLRPVALTPAELERQREEEAERHALASASAAE